MDRYPYAYAYAYAYAYPYPYPYAYPHPLKGADQDSCKPTRGSIEGTRDVSLSLSLSLYLSLSLSPHLCRPRLPQAHPEQRGKHMGWRRPPPPRQPCSCQDGRGGVAKWPGLERPA